MRKNRVTLGLESQGAQPTPITVSEDTYGADPRETGDTQVRLRIQRDTEMGELAKQGLGTLVSGERVTCEKGDGKDRPAGHHFSEGEMQAVRVLGKLLCSI